LIKRDAKEAVEFTAKILAAPFAVIKDEAGFAKCMAKYSEKYGNNQRCSEYLKECS
jgi:hypothetical protein